MSHGKVKLYETIAITSYIDTVFDGSPLQPADPLQLARMHQWISVFTQYLYRPAIDIVLQRIVVPMRGGAPDEALIRESIPKAQKALDELDGALAGRDYFAGDGPTFAGYFVFPVLPYLGMVEEGRALLAGTGNLTPWQGTIASRQSAKDTEPPLA